MSQRLTALAACTALLLVACGDDDEEPRRATAPETTTERRQAPTATTKAPGPKRERKPKGVDRRQAAVQLAFSELVEAYELSDQPRICELLGQSGASAETCAMAAGVNLMLLPSSEELSPERTTVKGRSARILLASGAVVELRRSGRKWAVTRLNSP